MPPLPGGVLDQPAAPGLRVTYADDGFLLATKLIAQRAKDADDVVALADRLGLSTATPEQLEAHIRVRGLPSSPRSPARSPVAM